MIYPNFHWKLFLFHTLGCPVFCHRYGVFANLRTAPTWLHISGNLMKRPKVGNLPLWDTDSQKLTQVKIVILPFWLSFIYHACYHFLKNYHFCYPFIYHFCYPVLRKYHFGYHVFIIIVIISWKNIILFVMLFIILLSFPEKLSFLYHVYYHLFIISRKMITKMINKWSPKW